MNRLREIPDQIVQSAALTSIDLSYNNMKSFPASIKSLRSATDSDVDMHLEGNPCINTKQNELKFCDVGIAEMRGKRMAMVLAFKLFNFLSHLIPFASKVKRSLLI